MPFRSHWGGKCYCYTRWVNMRKEPQRGKVMSPSSESAASTGSQYPAFSSFCESVYQRKMSEPGLRSVKSLGFVGDRGVSLMREGATKGLRRVASPPLGKPLGASPGASAFPGRRNWAARGFPGIRTMELRNWEGRTALSQGLVLGEQCDGTCRKLHRASKGARIH